MYNNVWYEGLNFFCLDLGMILYKREEHIHKENKIEHFNRFFNSSLSREGNLLIIKNKNFDFLHLSISSIRGNDVLVLKFRFIQKLDKEEYNVFSGTFTFNTETGVISDYDVGKKISFHEIMSNFFDFEILTLYQILSKML